MNRVASLCAPRSFTEHSSKNISAAEEIKDLSSAYSEEVVKEQARTSYEATLADSGDTPFPASHLFHMVPVACSPVPLTP